MKVSISEVKANLSKYVNLAYHGERIVILKNNIPLVDIVPHQVVKRQLPWPVRDNYFGRLV